MFYLHLLKHFAGKKTCKENVDEDFVLQLKQKTEEKHKKENKKRKAKSRKRIEASEDYDKRKDRLAMQSYYMEKSREKKRKVDHDGMKKKARESKATSRYNQKLFKGKL